MYRPPSAQAPTSNHCAGYYLVDIKIGADCGNNTSENHKRSLSLFKLSR